MTANVVEPPFVDAHSIEIAAPGSTLREA